MVEKKNVFRLNTLHITSDSEFSVGRGCGSGGGGGEVAELGKSEINGPIP